MITKDLIGKMTIFRSVKDELLIEGKIIDVSENESAIKIEIIISILQFSTVRLFTLNEIELVDVFEVNHD